MKLVFGRYESALSDCNKAIRLNPDYATVYANRGAAQICLGNIESARLDFQTALRLAKQHGVEDIKTNMERQIQKLDDMK